MSPYSRAQRSECPASYAPGQRAARRNSPSAPEATEGVGVITGGPYPKCILCVAQENRHSSDMAPLFVYNSLQHFSRSSANQCSQELLRKPYRRIGEGELHDLERSARQAIAKFLAAATCAAMLVISAQSPPQPSRRKRHSSQRISRAFSARRADFDLNAAMHDPHARTA